MKKIFIVMLLVIASGLWNSTNGACMVPAKSNSDLPTITMSGILYETAYPCEPGEMCPTCLTPALETDNGIYYLTTTDAEIEAQLDSLFNYLYSINCICTFPTRVTGTTYQNGSFKYINISHIETDDPQPVSPESKVKSQATQWFGIQYHHDYPQSEHTPIITGITYNLGPDTLINTKLYRQIRYTNESKKVTNAYHGAIRQSEDRQEVYYIPSGIDKEYLLYNFDVEQGDTVYAYAGFYDASCVEMIEYEQHQSITPAWIVQDIQVIDGRKHITVQQDAHVVEWIEGIGTKHILWPVGRGCYATGMEVQFHHTLCAADNEGNTIYSFDTDYIGIRNNCPDWEVLSAFAYEFEYVNDFHINGFAYKVLPSNTLFPYGSAALIEIADCNKDVVIPEFVSYGNTEYRIITFGIGSVVFTNEASSVVESITIPKTIDIINKNALAGCPNLKTVVVDSENPYYDSRENCNAIITTSQNPYFTPNTLIAGCKTTIIPNSVAEIGDNAFYNSALKSITIPTGTTKIGHSAFNQATLLSSIKLPITLTEIGDWAFADCLNLNTIICYALEPPTISSNTFFGSNPIYNNPSVYVPAESVEAYKNAEHWKWFTQILPIESTTSYKSQWCDTWNIFVENGSVYPPHEETYRYQLAQDTVIGEHTYTAVVSKAINDAFDAPHYVAAVRFTDDRKVYIYYDNAEYLLYDFNVQQGDELEVFAGINNYTSEIKTYKCTVTGVEQYACVGCPATITLEVHNHPDDFREFYRQTQWIEGVGDINGFLNGINGYINIPGNAAEYLLCAYKEGVQVYISKYGEEFGCEFNGIHTEDADTIPLYTGDDPGSSTVDPIDPNQVVVTLNGNELNIKESSGDEINYTLVLNKNKQAPTKEQTVQANSFIHSVSIELFESGYYTLQLTNPNWNSSLVGHFQYINTAIEEVQVDEKCNAKILRDGQLLIRRGERLYTPSGIQVQ